MEISMKKKVLIVASLALGIGVFALLEKKQDVCMDIKEKISNAKSVSDADLLVKDLKTNECLKKK